MNSCHKHGATVIKFDGAICPRCPAVKVNSIDATLAERGARYGDFTDHASLCQQIQDVMRFDNLDPRLGWARLTSDKRQALTVIADKIARILTGDPDYPDNWHDIQGYAKLAEDRCVDKTLPQLDLNVVDANPGRVATPLTEEALKNLYRERGGRPKTLGERWDGQAY